MRKTRIREELRQLLSEFGDDSAISSNVSTVNTSEVSWSNVSADSSLPSASSKLEIEGHSSSSAHVQVLELSSEVSLYKVQDKIHVYGKTLL